ncbi:hypothetical protein [Noviherbaspirillum galbum]|uniref:Uncharacterized protein n=1 Tax=Noviherbaspirillum galbum TaxID=2709383 RepID=A0A6B3STY4_9BURK|nr:hypothetical protein [Noviherbaspirillum galbum]NEX64061.1 hypothetical protein [Noviherbaspirillum galbum]
MTVKIDTVTTAQWIYQGAQKVAQEADGKVQQAIAEQRSMNRQRSEELKTEAAEQRSYEAQRRQGGIDVYA